MSEEFTLTSPGRASIGRQLAERREAMGLSVVAAAAKLRCDVSILASLEADRFEDLGAPVFAQGHLRRYAEFLGAPVQELLAEWSQRGERVAEPDLTRIPLAPVRAVDRQAWSRRITGLAGALVIALAAWWILKGAGVEAPMPSERSTATEDTPAGRSEAKAPAVAAVADSESAAPTVAATVPVPTAIPVAPSSKNSTVAVTAREDFWVEVYDSSNRRLYYDLVRRGGRAEITGVTPLRVVLGRADAVTLTIDGRTTSVPATMIREATAYLDIDAAGQLRALPPASFSGRTDR